MKTLAFLILAAVINASPQSSAQSQPVSEFDEIAIRTMQEGRAMPAGFQSTAEELEASSDPVVKAGKYEQLIVIAAEGFLSGVWSQPAGGWKLLDFPTTGHLTVEDVREQPSDRVFYTKVLAQNESEAVRLRSAGSLALGAALQGEQWGEKLLLDVAQRPDGNIKRLAYWFTRNFAQDWHTKGESATGATVWPVNWSAWQQAFNAANPLGKAIIVRNVATLAVRRNEVATAAAINFSALTGANRELKAIALAFGDPALGSAVTAKWAEIAGNASDPQMQALAREVRTMFGITD